ncbi:MAG: hypothetical protein DRI71_07005 [Bacteroidetes bacterium]|nr:MAG: hypothetical protein DRI71_07005 [Bacteroidota bacterium]
MNKSKYDMKVYIFIVLFSFVLGHVYAQNDSTELRQPQSSVMVETMIGNDYSSYQVILSKQIGSADSRFSFYSMINYDMYYDETVSDNYFLQSIFFYNITGGISVGTGVNSKPFVGTKPLIALAYSKYTESIGLYIQPSYETYKDGLFEFFVLFSWVPYNEKLIQPYFKFEGYTSWGSEHSYTYHNWRLGLQYKIIRLGPAINLAYFGENYDSATNWGGFVNISF